MRKHTGYHSLYEEDRIILELGRIWIKCGFGGESTPRHIYRNISNQNWKKVKRHEGSIIRTSLYRCLYEIFTEYVCRDKKKKMSKNRGRKSIEDILSFLSFIDACLGFPCLID